MKVAVVTPVGPNADGVLLDWCSRSVADQSYPCDHIKVADGGYQFCTIRLPQSANDIGSTPRAIGSAYAFGQGYDAVCWLDSDNWLVPDHVERLVKHHYTTGKPIVASGRWVTDVAGELVEECVEQVPGSGFFDTNTYLVTKEAKWFAALWSMLMPNQHIIGDRILSKYAEGHVSCHYAPTVYYRSRLKFHYDRYGWPQEGVNLEVKTYTP